MTTRTGRSFQPPEQEDEDQQTERLSDGQALVIEAPSFKLFQKLPAEIRHMIWREAIPKNRIIEIGSYVICRRKEYMRRLTSRTIVPPILHACSESRSVVTAPCLYEKLIFGGRFTGTYINYSTDIIMFKNLHEIAHSAVNVKRGWNASDVEQKCRALLLQDVSYLKHLSTKSIFPPSLERIFIVRRVPLVPELETSGDGNLSLFPISEKVISTYVNWRLTSHLDALKCIAEFQLKQPGIKQIELMTVARGPEKRYSARERAQRWRGVRVRVRETQVSQPRKINFSGYRVLDLRQASVERGLCSDGLKKALVERLMADEETRFVQAMEEYIQENGQ